MYSGNQPTPAAEAALIKKASQGNLAAFNQLILIYQDMAYHTAFSILGDHASAEDVTQEGFLKAFREIHHFRGGFFRAWLLRIVTNTAYDDLRKSKRHSDQPLYPEDEYGDEIESPDWLVDPAATVETTVEQNEDARRLYRLIDELPAAFRSVLTLVDIYELDYSEAAQILNLPVGTVKSRLARARLQLRGKILREFESFNHLKLPVSVHQF